jgi:hypothetical protein
VQGGQFFAIVGDKIVDEWGASIALPHKSKAIVQGTGRQVAEFLWLKIGDVIVVATKQGVISKAARNVARAFIAVIRSKEGPFAVTVKTPVVPWQ